MKKYNFRQRFAGRLSGSFILPCLILLAGCSMLPEAENNEVDATKDAIKVDATGTDIDPQTTPETAVTSSASKAATVTEVKKPATKNTVVKKPATKRQSVKQSPKPTITQANQLMKKGQRAAAADMYYRASFSYPSPQRERIMLQAAEISASLGNKKATTIYLQKVSQRSLTPLNKIRYNYVQSLLALHEKQPDQALSLLPAPASRLPKGLSEKIELVRKRAISMGGRPTGQPDASSTARRIVPTVPTVQSQTAPRQPDTMAIPHHQAQAAQQQQVLQQQAIQQQALQQQAQQNQPPAPAFVLPESSNKIAVLLPSKGALGKVGDEIYQGVKDAQSRYGSTVLSKRYDVDKNNVVQQYQQAVSDGADIVVGPLDKDSLAALTTQPQLLQVPVLSLNYLPGAGNLPHSLYQFGLSPEDEARQIATFALSRGQQNAIIMSPDSSWGKRLANAFAQTYQQRGGNILNAEFYPNSSPSTYLKRVQTLLENAQGANMVFLAASPTQARLLRPLLKDQAGILPVYATSHIFSGRKASNKDIDLDGIIYTEIPYILQKSEQGSLDDLKFPRLYALGMDAVTVAKNLSPLVQRQVLPGQTGQISMDPQRRLQRQLEFATFINGQPHNLGQ